MYRLLLAGAFALTITPALAQSYFDNMDIDHDGLLTITELQTVESMGYPFANIDKNHDGYVTAAEFPMAGDGSSTFFKAASQHGGKLSQGDFEAARDGYAEMWMDLCDSDFDDAISRDEAACVFGSRP